MKKKRRRKRKAKGGEKFASDEKAKTVIDALKRMGGRANQKELRERTGIGEAQLSLIVSELEAEGIVKKFKKGRGNIVVLKGEANESE
ncbi:MAG: hypothetical protein V1494_02830 [Candidatus Diapherotrites archaeon]